MPNADFAQLRARYAPHAQGQDQPALPLGLADIDHALPWGGLALEGMHDIADPGDAAATGFCAWLLGRAARARRRPVLWLAAGAPPYAPALAALGLPPRWLVAVQARRPIDALWAAEEAARCPGLAAIVAELAVPDLIAARRLQLAAQAGGTMLLLLNRGAPVPNALTRWRVEPRASGDAATVPGRAVWRLALTRCRGAALTADADLSWDVEWCDATGNLRLAAGSGDRAVAPQRLRAVG
jgi:protein ImuA